MNLPVKRAFAFIDGQNLFHAAKEAFGYVYPNYDVAALAKAICGQARRLNSNSRATWRYMT